LIRSHAIYLSFAGEHGVAGDGHVERDTTGGGVKLSISGTGRAQSR